MSMAGPAADPHDVCGAGRARGLKSRDPIVSVKLLNLLRPTCAKGNHLPALKPDMHLHPRPHTSLPAGAPLLAAGQPASRR